MKRLFKCIISIGLSVGVLLCAGGFSAQAITQEAAKSGIERPIPAFVTTNSFDPDFVTDGAEYITVNADGSWTVTGDFTVEFPEPIVFDYRLASFRFSLALGETDGCSDMELLCASSPDTYEWLSYSEDLYGSPLLVENSVYFDLRNGVGRAGEVFYGWNTGYQVDVRAMRFCIGTATTVTITNWVVAGGYAGVTKDINSDGAVNTADARELLAAALGAPSGHLYGIDVDGNGVFDTADAREKLKQVMTL